MIIISILLAILAVYLLDQGYEIYGIITAVVAFLVWGSVYIRNKFRWNKR